MLINSRVKTNILGVLFVAAATVILSALFSVQVRAQSANVMQISPIRSDVQIAPGTSKKVTVKVTNTSSAPIILHPIANDFISGDERGTPALILDENEFAPTHSLKRFMMPVSDFTVPAKSTKEVGVVIIVPKDAAPGGYFGALRFAPANTAGGGQVNLNASAASLILLTVPGPAVEKLNLTSFNIQQGSKTDVYFQSPNDLQAAFRFENKGNVQLGPLGKLTVKEGDKVVYEADFNDKDQRDMVLPDSARRWEIPLKNIGSFGHYTVKALFTYGSKNTTIEVERSFWVIPWIVIIGTIVAVLVIIGLVVGIWLFLRSYKRRILRGSGRRGGGFRR